MFATSVMVCAVLSVHAPVPKPVPLTPEDKVAVRSGIYDVPMYEFYTSPPDLDSGLLIPKKIEAAYAKNADQVEALLLVIAEGAAPDDSIKAIAYLRELRLGTGSGLVCVHVFKAETYDVLSKNWKATPREHWITNFKDRRKEDEKK